MIASLADHLRKKEDKEIYEHLVGFCCQNISQTSTWLLILSLTNNIQQMLFSNGEAKELIKILCAEFGIRTSCMQYFKSFSSATHLQEKNKTSKIIQFSSKQKCHKANNERLIDELSSALQNKVIEYRQALELVSKIIENYPDTEKHLHGEVRCQPLGL